MQALKNFFLFCSGANQSILRRTPTEVNKYVGIGATIFFTGVFAAIAAAYAMYTVFDSTWIIVPVALLWGLMIFNLDRFIVSTMKKKGSFIRDFTSATPRIILAVLIAIVIAKPLELKIFESEIEAELVKMQQENFKEQDDLVRSRFVASMDSLKSEIAWLKKEVVDKEKERDILIKEANMEADGTGGSMRRNLGPIYRAKKAAADQVQGELDDLSATNTALIATKEEKLSVLDEDMKNTLNSLNRVELGGFAARLEGLERASQRSQAIYIASIFIMLLFIAVETAPVITKLILERSPYDYVLNKHESLFELNHQAYTAKHTESVKREAEFERSTKEHKTKLAIEAEKELAEDAIRRRVEELKGKTSLSGSFFSESNLLGG